MKDVKAMLKTQPNSDAVRIFNGIDAARCQGARESGKAARVLS